MFWGSLGALKVLTQNIYYNGLSLMGHYVATVPMRFFMRILG